MISRFSRSYKTFPKHMNKPSRKKELLIGVLWVKWEMAVSIKK